MSQSSGPIFITARFRSGSTLLWNMFRSLAGHRAYYEPCHPNLLAHIQYTRPMESHRGVTSYWDEYLPLETDLRTLHAAELGFDHLLLEADDEFGALERYLRFLINAAGADRAVLKFNRVDFRLPWLRARFPEALVVHLWRSPRESWVSTRRHLLREKWDDPDYDDAFELFQWCAALGEHFPFLIADQVRSSYQAHYYLWRLSELMGKRCSHVSLNYDQELRGDPSKGIGRLVEAGAVPPQLAAAAAAPVEPTEPLDWRQAHPESWFADVEQRCERELVELGLVESFGLSTLDEIRRRHKPAWDRCAAAPRKRIVHALLAVDARSRSEQTRLLHEARRSQAPKRNAGMVIDARCVGDELSGIARYALGLLEGLSQLELSQPIRVLVRSRSVVEDIVGTHAQLQFEDCGLGPWSLRSQLELPRTLRRMGCRVYHCPDLYAPLAGNGFARAITIHDVIPHVHRKHMRRSWKSRLFPVWDRWFRAQCRRADGIITVSDYSKRELVQLIGVPSQRVHRIYNGVRANGGKPSPSNLRERFKIKGRIISYIGRHDPYKNLGTLVKAFKEVAQAVGPDVTLVIAGKVDPRYEIGQEAARELGLADRVAFTGYLNESERLALLRESSVFVFPSRHEGFGLPPLEAMAEGVPVVAARATSLPEVLGDAALLVDPDDSRAMGEAILSILRDDALAASLRERGRRQAEKFTWRQCAAAHLNLYERLAAMHAGV